jgi:hypothetical protein
MAKADMKRGHDPAMGLRKAYRALHRRTDERLAKRSMTANQFVLLALLRSCGDLLQVLKVKAP